MFSLPHLPLITMKTLAVCASATVTLHDVVSSLEPRGIAADQVTLATNCATLAAESLGAGYDVVLSLASEPGHHSVQRLGALAAVLKPGGVLVVKETGPGVSSGVPGCNKANACWACRATQAQPPGAS